MEEKAIETRIHEDKILEIYQDEFPESPRECDNLGIMICGHQNYDLGDEQYDKDTFDGKVSAATEKLNLHLMDHSGLWMSTGPFAMDPQGWDSGIVGVIYTTEQKITEMFGNRKRPSKEKIAGMLEEEVKIYNQYLQGDIYCYTISEVKTCSLGEEHKEIIDSCSGFYNVDDIISDVGAENWECK